MDPSEIPSEAYPQKVYSSPTEAQLDAEQTQLATEQNYAPQVLEDGVVSFCNNNITKKILREGDGEVPLPGSRVTVHYTGRLKTNDKIFDNSRERDETYSFVIGAKEVIQGWDISIPSMRKGELADITIGPLYAYSDLGFEPDIPPNATLVFEVELLDWTPIRSNIGPGVEKIYTVKGTGWETPAIPSICKIKIEGRVRDENGPVYLRTDDFVDVDLDDPDVPEGLETALCSMKPGETALFWVDYMVSGNGFLPESHSGMLHEGSDVFFKIEMDSFTTNKQTWELSVEEKIEVGTLLKESGNKLYNVGQYKRALDRYQQTCEMFEYELDQKGETMKTIYEIMVACQSNVVAVKLKVGANQEAIEACDKILAVDPHHMKTLYRKAQAFVNLQMTEEALNVLTLAADIPCPDSQKKGILNALAMVRQKYEAEIQAEKNRWKKALRK